MAYENKNSSKPRQVRGTTAYKYRNLFVFGIFAVSGLSWYLFEWVIFFLYFSLKMFTGCFAVSVFINNVFKNGYNTIKQDLNYFLKNIYSFYSTFKFKFYYYLKIRIANCLSCILK